MISFYGKQELKGRLLSKMRTHIEKDRLSRGHYGLIFNEYEEEYEDCGFGCFIYCCADKKQFFKLLEQEDDGCKGLDRILVLSIESEYGLPSFYLRWAEDIFENSANQEDAAVFTMALLNATPVGVNLQELLYRHVNKSIARAEAFSVGLGDEYTHFPCKCIETLRNEHRRTAHIRQVLFDALASVSDNLSIVNDKEKSSCQTQPMLP